MLEGIDLEEDRFGFEQEITIKIAKNRWRVYEVPISYYGRTYAEGKKITWKDGFRALWCILRYSLRARRAPVRRSQAARESCSEDDSENGRMSQLTQATGGTHSRATHPTPQFPGRASPASIYPRFLLLLFFLTLPLVNPWVRGDGVGYYAYVRSLLVEHKLDFANDWRAANESFTMGRVRPDGTH